MFLQDVKRKPASGIPREQTLLARRLRNDLSDAETKVAIQQLKNKLSPTEAVNIAVFISKTKLIEVQALVYS